MMDVVVAVVLLLVAVRIAGKKKTKSQRRSLRWRGCLLVGFRVGFGIEIGIGGRLLLVLSYGKVKVKVTEREIR